MQVKLACLYSNDSNDFSERLVSFVKKILMGLLLLAAAGYGGAKAYIHYKVSDSVDTARLIIAPYAAMEYGGVSSTLDGELTLDNVRLQLDGYRDEIFIGRLGINTPSFLTLLQLGNMMGAAGPGAGSTPKYFGLIAEDVRIPVFADYHMEMYKKNIETINPGDIRQRGVQCVGKYGHSPKALQKLGYDELVGSTSITMRQADGHFITEMDIDVVDMVDLDIELKLAGDAMSGAVAIARGYQPLLQSVQVKLTDRSFNQRINKYCTELGLTPDQILQAHLNAMQYFGSTMGIKFDRYVLKPYKEFLGGKPVFIVTANPREPLELTTINKYRPSDVPALLRLEAVAQ